MGKIKDNPRVIIEPYRSLSWISVPIPTEDQENDCKNMIEQIKRHIDNVENIYIEYDYICEFCGYPWEEIDENNFCCNKAEEEWKRLRQNDI